ncbi:MAG TPA: glutamate-5-semialdehyde dehydrogenase [Verrucomicrobiae bacterium]|nr:glutamate-5-semialdehyde dehydrogenase [Verrucomicrobiae bacterium]
MSDDVQRTVLDCGRRARAAARALVRATTTEKNRALDAIAAALESSRPGIHSANHEDVLRSKQSGLAPAMVDRLTLTEKRFEAMVQGVRDVAALSDPVGEIIREWTRPNGLRIIKRRFPIGVVGIIFESRPNVTCDAAVLCLKTGNATLLRGGKEAFLSNRAIVTAMAAGLTSAGLPADSIQLIPTTDREAVRHMCEMDQFLDVIVPRGGPELIQAVVRNARMPVIKHYKGVCHVYIDRAADLAMAERIAINAKCQRPAVCNAMETLLVDAAIAPDFLPLISARLAEKGVELRGCARSRELVASMKPATENDWFEEYNDLILSVRIVDGIAAAIDHIEQYGSRHSDAIVTRDQSAARRFLEEVDSATVYWNASTRFTDGGEFGMGAEIGISTDKLHARGPMALEELTTYKYQIIGSGQIRE